MKGTWLCNHAGVKVTERGEEWFREEGEMAQKIGGGGRKDAKK